MACPRKNTGASSSGFVYANKDGGTIRWMPTPPRATSISFLTRLRVNPQRALDDRKRPKSDINAALEAGLNAVFVPHRHTWVLEKQELRAGAGKLLVLEGFRELREHF